MQKQRWFSIYFFLVLLVFGLASSNQSEASDNDVSKMIKMPNFSVDYKENLPFKIGIALNDNVALRNNKSPFTSVVMQLQETGTPNIVAIHQSPRRILAMTHEKISGVTGYNLAYAAGEWKTNFIVTALDKGANTFFIPMSIPELGVHETAHQTRDGHMFMFYVPKQHSDGSKRVELGLKEYDRTGSLLWQWESEKISPVHSSVFAETPPDVYADYLHANSISTYGNYIVVSARNSSEILLIERETRRLVHKIGLLDGWLFKNDPLNGFRFQHHAQIDEDGILSLLDNGGTYNEAWDRPFTRAVRYKLDLDKKTATLVDALPIYGPLQQRTRQGSFTVLKSGYSVVSWGLSEPAACSGISEKPVVLTVYKNSQIVADVRADCGWFTYRAMPIFD
jgi:Arylsulfotransferase (ASST)